MEKEPTEEQMRMAANEALLASKAYLLFVVCADGSLQHLGDTKKLNPAEDYGLFAFSMDHLNPPEPPEDCVDCGGCDDN